MNLPIPVFTASEAKAKRGENAKEMLACPICRKVSGILISEMQSMKHEGVGDDDVPFHTLVWERWHCLECRNIWVERYGVTSRRQGDKSRVQECNPDDTTPRGD